MPNILARLVLGAVFVAIASLPVVATADERPGTFGFSMSVDGDGFFLDPTLSIVTIDAVTPGSPAAGAGLAPHDRIVEVEGHPVAGAKASTLKPYLKRKAGESIRLRLRRPGGDEYDVVLVAAPKA